MWFVDLFKDFIDIIYNGRGNGKDEKDYDRDNTKGSMESDNSNIKSGVDLNERKSVPAENSLQNKVFNEAKQVFDKKEQNNKPRERVVNTVKRVEVINTKKEGEKVKSEQNNNNSRSNSLKPGQFSAKEADNFWRFDESDTKSSNNAKQATRSSNSLKPRQFSQETARRIWSFDESGDKNHNGQTQQNALNKAEELFREVKNNKPQNVRQVNEQRNVMKNRNTMQQM